MSAGCLGGGVTNAYNIRTNATPEFRSDIPIEKVRSSAEVIQPGDNVRKVIDYLGMPQHKQEHLWEYSFQYGVPWQSNTPMASVSVWLDDDRVREVKVKYQPARTTVESAKTLLKPGMPAKEVRILLGTPEKISSRTWHYGWTYYGASKRLVVNVEFTDGETVAKVEVRSFIVCF